MQPTRDIIAAARAAACSESRGLIAHVEPGDGLRLDHLHFSVPPLAQTESEIAPIDEHLLALGHGCVSEQYLPVLENYQAQLAAPTADALAEYKQQLESCIAAGGHPALAVSAFTVSVVYEGDTRHLAIAASQVDAFRECAFVAEAATGLLPPPPTVVVD